MTPELVGILGIVLLIILFLLKVPVGISLVIVGFLGTSVIRGWNVAFTQLGRTPLDTAASYSLSVIPLFILMGMVLSYTGLGQNLYRAIDSWIGHFQGGLAMATIGTSALFSSISGSLNATTVTMGKIALPEMEKFKYHPGLSTASVVAGGTLGPLIPPSVILVLYGIMTREPIGKLLLAGMLPGLLQVVLFMLTIYLLVRRNPALAPVRDSKATFKERIRLSVNVLPFIFIFLIVIGGIYLGVFTPTEAAGVGTFITILVALVTFVVKKDFNFKAFKHSFDEGVRLTAYIFLILMGANLFSQFLSVSRIPVALTNALVSIEMNNYVILFLMLLGLLVLGCFIEGLSLMLLTLPIVYPIVIELGFNGIWFGIIMVLVVNMAAVTPPLGVAVYDVKGVARHVPIQTIFRGIVPILFAMLFGIILLIIFPQIVTILPDMMK